MVSWVEGFQQSIDYIEGNLASSLEIEDIARTAMLSPFYYQRMFGALCGMTVGEYIRGRRMTLAAQELAGTDAKVIDVALKYGYPELLCTVRNTGECGTSCPRARRGICL